MADTILHNAVVVTMDGELRVLRDGLVAVAGDRIAAVWPLRRRFVNTHVHTSQQLARGIADDVDLMTWLHGRIWPYESHMTEEDSYASTLLCGIELIRSGLQKELYEKHHKTADGHIRIWFGLRQIMNATDRLLLETRDVAQKLNTGIHMHIAEIPYENQLIVRTKGIDHGTVTYLEKIDFLRSNLLAAHSVWLNEPEIGHFSKAGVKVSHCPASAMRLLGFAPIREMLDSGVCVSLGTDGAPSNNRMSIVDEMYLASLINKGREAYISGTTNPTALPSETVLKMATINGAKAVLWDNEIGSLEVGKKADLVVVNPFTWSMVPLHDSIANIVYCMRTENIESVMCNGRWIMKDHKIMNLNEEEMTTSAVFLHDPDIRSLFMLFRYLANAVFGDDCWRCFFQPLPGAGPSSLVSRLRWSIVPLLRQLLLLPPPPVDWSSLPFQMSLWRVSYPFLPRIAPARAGHSHPFIVT
ncbi:uncharacterized protein C2845_PM06G28560 [Panicum miliaceum]|uniref:Amidohydrolase-related domain-containing protein n=1 Tax=Panicum miliaceum TaxID=4540 RepID=A0A3L6REL0_PANMI|nr:uncharacterized protein C2845_PM06G28560 [Panicum miliaceum]